MFGSTQTLTYDGASLVLARINQDQYSSEYLKRSDEDEWRMKIRHSNTTPRGSLPMLDRHNVEIIHTVFGDGELPDVVTKVYFVTEQLPRAVDVKIVATMAAWMAASSGANIDDLVGWQS